MALSEEIIFLENVIFLLFTLNVISNFKIEKKRKENKLSVLRSSSDNI